MYMVFCVLFFSRFCRSFDVVIVFLAQNKKIEIELDFNRV